MITLTKPTTLETLPPVTKEISKRIADIMTQTCICPMCGALLDESPATPDDAEG